MMFVVYLWWIVVIHCFSLELNAVSFPSAVDIISRVFFLTLPSDVASCIITNDFISSSLVAISLKCSIASDNTAAANMSRLATFLCI